MKHLIPVLLILLTGSVFAADYTKIDIPTTASINQVYFMNDQLGWAATSAGQVLSTFDGGKTWRMSEPTTRSIHDICIEGRQGYLVGERGLLMRSTDGGATWEDISLNIKYDLVGVGITNDSSIIVCGNDMNSVSKSVGVVFESRDYGKTWKKHGYRLGNGYTDLAIYPPRKVYLLAAKKEFHSINNGLRYFKGGYPGNRLGFNFDFIDAYGYMVGYKGLFARTIDHGRNWEELPIDITKNLYAVEMFDESSGVAVGQDGLVIYFYDSGDRHTVENCGYKQNLRAVFVTGQKIFMGGDDGLLLVKERFPRYDEKKQGK